jgi:hypothetical protein
MERGQLGALNYRMSFPGQQQVDPASQAAVQQQQGGDPYQYELPDKLANRQAKTKQLIERYNNLKSLAAEFERLGEVWDRPDLSQDDGGLAYQTILAADAGVKYAAQELANEAAAEQQLRPLEAQGKIRFNEGVDPTQDIAYSDPSKYYSTDPMPFVDEANRRLNTPTYTTRDQNNFNQAYLDPNVQRIDQMIASGQMSPEEGAFQKANLQRNVAQTAYQQLIQGNKDNDKNSKYGYQLALLRKYTNLKNGVWPEGAYNKTTVNGKVYLKNEDGKGDVLGKYTANPDKNGNPVSKDKIVDAWLKDPQTGKVYVKFTDPEIPMEELSNQSGDAITRTFVSNNSKYGSVDKIMEAATAVGLMDEKGSSVDQMLMPQNFQDIQSGVRNSGTAASARVEQEKANIKSKLKGIKSGAILYANGDAIPLPDGRIMEVARHKYSGGEPRYFIRNYDELGLPEQPENLTEDEVIEYLSEDYGYFNQFLEQAPTESTQGAITSKQQKAIEAFTKQFNRQPNSTEIQKIMSKFK